MNSNQATFKKPEIVFQFYESEMEEDQQIEDQIEDFQTKILGMRVKTTRNITLNFKRQNSNEKINSFHSLESSQEQNY
ncbi:hypothetical protein TTHERM_00812840 (macronuclear) [Tetrahymena thermophila SB210]|uniref:Uncharacterized protein n=1 Tax=Tetrahymena thermophila (strain SB210) TaxID=312017 RepID=Q22SU7_TETTS|nr:hypothetical protein TTHERM_00812840 [Tetrahymena thermophila SB210]EAR88367.1 hypothetical protein TTHERM_00812840 [Tetrahymena thermophila SB210]|eukprot:XP_001008612.1 hypothetical protein TTHERM_00812840 [Tetrahymena thermophila SB210]